MEKAPNLWSLEWLIEQRHRNTLTQIPGHGWVPARPRGYFSLRRRLRLAWGVFTGQYDAVVWPGNQ